MSIDYFNLCTVSRIYNIIQMREDGCTRKEIAEKLNISRNLLCVYIRNLIKKGWISKVSKREQMKRQARVCGFNKVDFHKGWELRDKGVKDIQIAKEFGVTPKTLKKYLGPKGVLLTRNQRIILWLRQQNYTYKEIADRLHLKVGTICHTFYYMRKKGLIV